MKSDEYEEYDNLFPDIHNSLSTCSLCSQCHNFIGQDIIWGNGPRDARIMVVGKDSSGKYPNERLWKGSKCTMIPLTNKKSGAKIRRLFNNAGLDPHKVFFTNTVKCNTGYDKFGLTFRKLAKCCTNHLLNEITIIEPKAIIFLGRHSFEEFKNCISFREETFETTGLNDKAMLSKPFVAKFTVGVSSEIYNIFHPSRMNVFCSRLDYVETLKQIKDRLL